MYIQYLLEVPYCAHGLKSVTYQTLNVAHPEMKPWIESSILTYSTVIRSSGHLNTYPDCPREHHGTLCDGPKGT